MMKKSLLYSAAVLATWGMTSCSNEVLDDGLQPQPTSQVIELAVENAGSGLGARVGRPLLSSEADQNIDNVYVFVVENTTDESQQTTTSKVMTVSHIKEWNKPSAKIEDYNDASGHGRKMRIEVTNKDIKDTKGKNFVIYAIGYSSDTKFKVGNQTLSDYLEGVKVGATDKTFENLVLTNSNSFATQADEFFAGKATIKFSDEVKGKFSQGITLHRQVAGVFTYVKNVPYMLDHAGNVCSTLQLVASKPNKNIVLGELYDKTLAQNGEKNTLKDVVNGTESFSGKEIVSSINLNDWFSSLQDENNDGVLDRYAYKVVDGVLLEDTDKQLWKNPKVNTDGTAYEATFVKGSVFDGQFIIPFQNGLTQPDLSGEQTFTLELVSNDKREVVRTWGINLPEAELPKTAVSVWMKNQKWLPSTLTENNKSYSVLRNHLYGVGTKVAANPAEKPQPGQPDPNPDPNPEKPEEGKEDPQDLNTKQDILLQVNDNWEVIHKMEVE